MESGPAPFSYALPLTLGREALEFGCSARAGPSSASFEALDLCVTVSGAVTPPVKGVENLNTRLQRKQARRIDSDQPSESRGFRVGALGLHAGVQGSWPGVVWWLGFDTL